MNPEFLLFCALAVAVIIASLALDERGRMRESRDAKRRNGR